MKRTGKIIQIVKEEEYKKYGFYKYVGYDYLNIRPIEEREPKKSIRNLTYLFIVCLIIIGSFMMGAQSRLLSGLFLICCIGMATCIFYNDNYVHKNVPKKYWLTSPFPIKKPHNFKGGDIVEIEINIKKK